MSKRYILLIIVVGVSSIVAGITIKRKNIEKEQLTKDIIILYERQLFRDIELQQQVEEYSSPENVLELFRQHEKQLNAFADQCYSNRTGPESFFVKYRLNHFSCGILYY